jgi:hypothetical protein
MFVVVVVVDVCLVWIEVGVECDFVFYFGPKLDLLLSTNGLTPSRTIGEFFCKTN